MIHEHVVDGRVVILKLEKQKSASCVSSPASLVPNPSGGQWSDRKQESLGEHDWSRLLS